jgi:hypothetical protein
LAYHGKRPEEHNEREPDGRSSTLHHHVGGNLGSDIEGKKDGKAVIVLKTMELEVFFEMVKAGVADVRAVEET